MNNISIKDFETERLIIKKPTMDEQHALWNILRQDEVNRYYFPTPDRIFNKNNLNKETIEDLKVARKIFMEQLNDWERQAPFYEKKIESINNEENSQKFTWSIFLKSGEPIGQITVQPSGDYEEPSIRDIGWFINPKYQGQGLGTEAATAVLEFMFNEVEIDRIETSAAIINVGSWRVMEKLGFEKTGIKTSTYYDEEDNILDCYTYMCNKDLYLNRENNKKI